MAVAEGFEPSHGRINGAVPYQLGYATREFVAGAEFDLADVGKETALRSVSRRLLCSRCDGCGDEI